MLNSILFCILLAILAMLVVLTYRLHSIAHAAGSNAATTDADEEAESHLSLTQGFLYAAIVITILILVFMTWHMAKGSAWEGHIMEWLNIIVRLMHITFGIAWIGASFYFVFLENALNRTENVREELAGNLWAVHGGGFYYLEKYKVAPGVIPKNLHWFKYEAYFTWLSGFSLLFVVYYFNASAYLIDSNVLAITPLQGIAIGVGSFAVAWIIYHLLCKTRLVYRGPLFALAGLVVALAFAWMYSHVFSSRAAYIHFGAMLGTLMAGNVFFVIIPSQKAMVRAAKKVMPLDPALGKFAALRSLHNNYLTLPVLFVMVSNHFPSTFGSSNPWLILIIISVGAAGVKHWLNLREKGQLNLWVLPVSVAVLLAATYMTAPAKPGECKGDVSFAEVNSIVQKRCISCHSSKPTDDVFTAPPNGVVYDTPEDIVRLKDKIMERVVITKTMPQNNKTNITQAERDKIGCWIRQGASLK